MRGETSSSIYNQIHLALIQTLLGNHDNHLDDGGSVQVNHLLRHSVFVFVCSVQQSIHDANKPTNYLSLTLQQTGS